MAGVAVAQMGSMNTYITPNATPSVRNNVGPGNSVICVCQSYGGSGCNVSSITGCGVNWQKAISGIAQTVATGTLDIWYGTNSTGGPNTSAAKVTFGGSSTQNCALIMECSPIQFDNALKIESATGQPMTPLLVPGFGAGELFIGSIVTGSATGDVVAPWKKLSAYTDWYQEQGFVIPGNASPQQMAVNTSGSQGYSAAIAAFAPASGVEVPTYVGIIPLPAPVTTGSGVQSYTDPNGDLWVAANGVNGGAWKRARDVLYSRIYRTAAYTVGTAYALYPFDTVSFDAYGMFSASLNGFQIPVSGLYRFNVVIATSIAGNQWTSMNIRRNGNNLIQGTAIGGNIAGTLTCQSEDISPLSANDQMNVLVAANASVAAAPNPLLSFFSIAYIGTG